MKTKKFYIPSITRVLEEYQPSFPKDGLVNIQKLVEPIFEIIQQLYAKKLIIQITCQPVKINEIFMILYKVFYAETKYFKVFLKFSLKNQFLGISLKDANTIISPYFFKNKLEDLMIIEIENGHFGIEIENDYMKFLPLFKANNHCCIGFQNVTCNSQYDRVGIDYLINFKQGQMPMQLKGVRDLTDQHHIAEKHFNVYPLIPLMFTVINENYLSRKDRLLKLRNKFWAEEYPFVSFWLE